jgi:TonB-dependent SusC/RagA subfamily outer membrane receptor
MRRFALAIGWLLAVEIAVGPRGLTAQGTGTVTGRVTDKASGSGIPNVQISVNGMAIRAQTNDSGFFRLRSVPAGAQTIRAIRLGYSANTGLVSVADGGTANVDLALTAASVTLSQVVITGTGQTQESRQSAVMTPTITPDSLNLAAAPNFASVLEGSAPGVQVVQSSGTSGAGARIRVRGASSVSLSNEPLLVIDGVEVNENPLAFGANPLSLAVGGQQPSRINDVNPDDIESVQTLQGPAATGLYGTAAANGVIVITTKRGQAGRQHWDGFVENGEIHDDNNYPSDFTGSDSTGGFCFIFVQNIGGCNGPITKVQSFNPLRQSPISPIRTGRRQEYNLSTSGGSDVNQYFVAGDYQLEDGTDNVNQLQKTNARANFTTRPRQDLSISFSGGYIASNTRFPQNDNNSLGVMGEALLGSPPGIAANNYGWFGGTINPAVISHLRTFQDIQRWTPSLNASYQPLSWLTATVTGGFDIVNQDDNDGVQPNIVPPGNGNLTSGFRNRNQLETETYTINSNLTAVAHLPADITSTSTVGGSWRRNLLTGTYTIGFGLSGGSFSDAGVSKLIQVSEVNQDNRVLGGFLQQQFGWRDKLFLTGGVRLDKNSSTGVAAGTTAYPTGSIAYVVSDEPWFPKSNIVTALKLRAAIGQSGLHPNFLDALTFKNPVISAIVGGGTEPAFTAGNPGNINLKPERTTEVETGLDLSVLRDRLTVGLTYFDKHTQDALIQQVLVGSIGDTDFRWINVGKVRNRGLEIQTTANVLQMKLVNFSVTGTFSTLENRLQELGSINGQQIQPIIFGLGAASQEHAQGFPLGGYWQQPYTYADKNHDGIIEPNEITVSPNRAYLGSSLPTELASLSPQITIWRIIKVSSLFDFQGGNKLYNATGDFRCGKFLNCSIDYIKGPLADQARAAADAFYNTQAGYIEDATFWKWREAAISLLVPPEYARHIFARGATITFAARNLRVWTKYTGLDPELSQSGATNFTSADFLTQPPVRYYTVRVTLNY